MNVKPFKKGFETRMKDFFRDFLILHFRNDLEHS